MVGLDLPLAGGGTEAGLQSLHQGNCLGQRRNLRLRVKQLTCDSLNGMVIIQTIAATAVHTLDRDVGPLEGTVAGNCSIGIVEQSQGEFGVDCRKMAKGDVREEIVVVNACGGKPGSHGGKAIL